MKGTSSVFLVLIFAFINLGTVSSEGFVNLSGTVENGTKGVTLDEAQLPIKLNVLEGIVSIDERVIVTESGGAFGFNQIGVEPSRIYVVSVEYKGVTYSRSLEYDEILKPITITVFETNSSSDILTFESYNVIVTGTDPKNRLVEILERISIRNDTDTTFSPKFQQSTGGMPDLLRFALPNGAENLDVRSNLVGGQILEVDKGFAIDTPVPPTMEIPHYLEFIYRIEYAGEEIDIGRTMRFGAEYLRLVVPRNSGIGKSSHLSDLGVAQIGDREFQLLEANEIPKGFKLDLFVEKLPQPTIIDKVTLLMNGVYIKYALPAILVLVLIFSLYKSRNLATQSNSKTSKYPQDLPDRIRQLDQKKIDD